MTRVLTEKRDEPPRQGLIFDCDGVLLNSNRLKQRAFVKTLGQFGFSPKTVRRFSEFQTARFGMSRYRLFEELLKWDDPACARVSHDDLLCAFGALMRRDYAASRATPGLRGVLSILREHYRLFIISGSDQAELRELIAKRDWGAFFDDVLGSPISKSDNIKSLLAANCGMKIVAFIGDAEADFSSASMYGIDFIYMDQFSTAKSRMAELRTHHLFPQIKDLRDLPPLVGIHGADGSN